MLFTLWYEIQPVGLPHAYNDAEMRHETEITKNRLNDHSFFTVYSTGCHVVGVHVS